MKKKIWSIVLLSIFFALIIIPANKIKAEEPDDWYEITYYFSYENGNWYYITECTDSPGDACNIPGSIHRSKIWWLPG
jgi:hypothetical protein